jgi:hypothetical protein
MSFEDPGAKDPAAPPIPMKNCSRRLRLSEATVLAWADAHERRTGRYPTQRSGPVRLGQRLTWNRVAAGLREGLLGFAGGSSLAQLLAQCRGVPNRSQLPRLSEALVLRWAQEHFRRTGGWPNHRCGPVLGAPGESWLGLQTALVRGLRGLPDGSSVARLLAKHGYKRNPKDLPPLTVEQILCWAEAAARQTGRWPNYRSGPVLGAPEESWQRLQKALVRGLRGLPGGSSVARLLAEHGYKRNPKGLPPLTVEQILAWAEAASRQMGRWPTRFSGPVLEAPGETWLGLNIALHKGRRGLPGGWTLFRIVRLYRAFKFEVDFGRELWEGRKVFEGTPAQYVARYMAQGNADVKPGDGSA